jgi:hypothetical protein
MVEKREKKGGGGVRNMLTNMHCQTPKSNILENRSTLNPEIVQDSGQI